MEKEFITAFKEIVREQLVKKNEVHIEGLGSFSSEHIQQHQTQQEDGQVLMMPPKDTITFNPAKR